ncbi:luciferase domain-containing protein [Williamsia sp. M5A3_1d]
MNRLAQNYRGWKELGPGGLPANQIGWVITSALRPWGRDPLDISGDPPAGDDVDRLHLPDRDGCRPAIAPYPIPHREIGADVDSARVAGLETRLREASAENGFRLDRSRFEKRGDALFCSEPGTDWARHARGEIAHVHRQGSLHVVAAPADVHEIIDRGWGERHPLAGRIGLPDSYLYLYAPRTDVEQAVVERIVDRVIHTAR